MKGMREKSFIRIGFKAKSYHLHAWRLYLSKSV